MVRLRRGAASADSLRVQLACQPKLPEESSRPDGSEGWRPHGETRQSGRGWLSARSEPRRVGAHVRRLG